MAGILSALVGSSGDGAASITLPVGYSNWTLKGSYIDRYGYDAASATNLTYSPAPDPATYKGYTIAIAASQNSTGTTNLVFAIFGMDTALGVSKLRMNGTDYTMGSPTQNATLSNTVTFSSSSGLLVTWTGHNFANNDMIYFTTSGTLPSGVTANTLYYVRNPTTNSFYLSTTPGGTILSFVSAGSGTHTAYWKPYVQWTSSTPTPPANATGGRTSFSPTISNGAPAVVTFTSHGLTNGKRVMFLTSGALPTGLSPNTIYYVVNAATNTFSVSNTLGGSAINTTSAGSGTHTCYEVVDIKVS